MSWAGEDALTTNFIRGMRASSACLKWRYSLYAPVGVLPWRYGTRRISSRPPGMHYGCPAASPVPGPGPRKPSAWILVCMCLPIRLKAIQHTSRFDPCIHNQCNSGFYFPVTRQRRPILAVPPSPSGARSPAASVVHVVPRRCVCLPQLNEAEDSREIVGCAAPSRCVQGARKS